MHERGPLVPIWRTSGFSSSSNGMWQALTKSGDRASVLALLSNKTKASTPPIFTSAVSVWHRSTLLSARYLPALCESLSFASRIGGVHLMTLFGILDPLVSETHEFKPLILEQLSSLGANLLPSVCPDTSCNMVSSSVVSMNESMLKLGGSS